VSSERNGLLVLDKPPGITSRDAVNAVVRLVGRKMPVGHAGTLDPLATGVLVVALGSATRLVEYVQEMAKTYAATVRLGARSDTDDADGLITPTASPRVPDLPEIEADLASRSGGWILQTPPRYSALKVAGRRAYDLARSGAKPDLSPRRVRIDRIAVIRYAWPDVELVVDCGSGTYIRSIARDLGDGLGCGGYITALRRTRIGPFEVATALGVEGLSQESIDAALQPPGRALAGWPRVDLTADEASRVRHGQALSGSRAEASGMLEAGMMALFGPSGELVAVGHYGGNGTAIRPRKVLVTGG
jgi:tRNA pseudouridine55 synthase